MASRKPVSHLSPLLRAMRLPFLALTLSSVFLGSCAALAAAGDIAPVGLTLVLLGALCAHLSVNLLNEYHDFRSGLDALTVRTPFSGGSGALVDHPQAQSTVLRAGLATLAITIVIGGYLALARNPLILPIGILGVVLIASYTPWLNRRPLLCLVAPGIAFGPLMVGGTQLALNPAGPVDWWLGVIPFCLANNLLLLNQLPDLEADRSVGRRHLPIAHGTAATAFVFVQH